MSATVDLQQMTVAEKLQLMETLWRDLSRENHASPAWHGEILAQRDRLTAAGEEQFVDWETAKKQLRQELP